VVRGLDNHKVMVLDGHRGQSIASAEQQERGVRRTGMVTRFPIRHIADTSCSPVEAMCD
jgi:hypothetical protein